ncbi:MAG: hypothetical protein MR582_05540, partial [Campylobacter sp.]|nr:hypothetical protein [Campylobacter sp.]
MGENLGFLGILEFLSLCHCEGAKRPKQSLGILEFPRFLQLLPQTQKDSTNLEFPKQNSRIPKNKSRIPRECFASLAMTRALEF